MLATIPRRLKHAATVSAPHQWHAVWSVQCHPLEADDVADDAHGGNRRFGGLTQHRMAACVIIVELILQHNQPTAQQTVL
jgi:hypothetical protein